MRILIVGAGIAGPTLAYWLTRFGHEPTLVEQAPRLRSGGYIIDFWGAGFEVAERMGIVPELRVLGYRPHELREVSVDGRVLASFDPRRLLDSASGGSDRYVSVARSDLSSTIMLALDGVETIFGESVAHLVDDGDRVLVTLDSGRQREFDLVIGADGLHSRVRHLAFGPDAATELDLGLIVAVFDVDGYRPRDDDVVITQTGVGYQALRFAQRDDSTMLVFTVRHRGPIFEREPDRQQQLLRNRLFDAGGEVPSMLAAMPRARDFYLDRASQIRMPSWSRGRVALIGDAAAAPSLLAGQGSALAMVEAYELAAALAQHRGNHTAAFTDFQQSLHGLVEAKQDAALRLEIAFAPRTRTQLRLRTAVMRMLAVPMLSGLLMRRSLRDPVRLSPPP